MDSHEVSFPNNIEKHQAQRDKVALKEDVKVKVDGMGLQSADKETLKNILDDIMDKLV